MTNFNFLFLLSICIFASRSLRLAAYRQYTCWVHGYLGRGDRRVIPPCVVTAIREAFPDPSQQYKGFEDARDDEEEPFWPG